MNNSKIRFVVNGETKEIEVISVYPYLINKQTAQVVLRMTVNEADASYDDIYSLKSCTGTIEQFERSITNDSETGDVVVGEWEKVNVFEGYNSGDIVIGYQNGQYSADLTRLSKYERMIEQNTADIQYIAAMSDIPLE